MAIKSKFVAYLSAFGLGVLEHGAEPVKAVAEASGTGAALATALTGVVPIAILAAPLVEAAIRHFENRADPEVLTELYRKSLLDALETCEKALSEGRKFAQEDSAVLELWKKGLGTSAKNDPWWHAMLDEDIPPATLRLLSVELGDDSSYWPVLRTQLERWSDWFRYRKQSAKAPLGIDVPREPLVLSPYLEEYLAVNLTAGLREKFSEITSGHQREAFNQATLKILSELNRELVPLDPLERIRDFKKKPELARTELQLLDPDYRAIPFVGRRGDLDLLWRWLKSRAPISIQVVAGRGGSGKTRLAYQFLDEIEQREPRTWHAGILPHDRFPNVLTNERFRRWPGRKPTLIVIDYAASSLPQLRDSVIPELERHMPGAAGDVPLRILLLERTANEREGWYSTLRLRAGSSTELLFPNPPLALGGLARDERHRLFDSMLEAAPRCDPSKRARLPLPPGSDQQLDAQLAAPQLGDPLVLFMAAMVAHDRRNLGALALNRTALARYVAFPRTQAAGEPVGG